MPSSAPPKRARLSVSRIHEAIGYGPHSAQREIHMHEAFERFLLVCAGRRTGKSTLGGHRLTLEALKARLRPELSPHERRAEFWIVGPEYTDAEKEFRVLYNDLKKLEVPFDHPGTYYDANGGNMHLSLWGGNFLVHAKSAKYPDSLVGEALEGVILAEAAKLKPQIWTKYIRPMLADYRGWGLMTSTPEGKNWFYDQYMRGQSQLPEDSAWWSKRMPSWSNDILFPAGRNDPEILDMSRDMTEEKFKQEIGAEFTEFTGRVFKRFVEESHVGTYSYNPRLPLYIATDYGYTNPNVALFIQVDAFDTVTVIAEYYQRGRTSEEFADDLAADPKLGPLARAATLLFPDPEDPGATATLAKRLRLQPQKGTGGLLRDRLDLIRRWLKSEPAHLEDGHPDKIPKLLFDQSCINTIREMNDYRYPDTVKEVDQGTTAENPKKDHDHSPEALGRFFGGHFGESFKEKPKARVSQASMGRSR